MNVNMPELAKKKKKLLYICSLRQVGQKRVGGGGTEAQVKAAKAQSTNCRL